MWYKKVLSTIIFIFIIFLVLTSSKEAESIALTNEKRGNSTGNISNEGFAAQDGQWIYYSTESGLWKVTNDNKSNVKISEDKANYINVIDGWIYYINLSDSNIYKLKSDGTEKTRILDDTVVTMDIVENTIYYSSNTKDINERPLLYKMSLNGTNRLCLTPKNSNFIDNILVSDNKPYYIYRGSTLTKTNTDGTNKLFVSSDHVKHFCFSKNQIYYTASRTFQKSGLMVINPNGTNKKFLSKDVGSFNVQGDYIFYEKLQKPDKYVTAKRKDKTTVSYTINEKLSVSLNKMNLDGSNDIMLTDESPSKINIAGDWIFYKVSKDGNNEVKMYKIKSDGSEKQLLN
jgi:hypothetical protein